ncbi:MAG TPA: hypothetical protein VGP95_14375 [Gemmatimonadaceae bacterium]|nr:hypothetical protein [Gemmatimonadaceae bacterium]
MIHFVTTPEEVFTIRDYLSIRGTALAPRFRIVEYERLAEWTHLERGTYVLSALDQLSPGMLRLVETLVEQFEQSDGVRFVNHPSRTMQRFKLLQTLSRLGRNDFRAERVTRDHQALRFPVFLRSERDHGGPVSPLLHSSRDVDTAIVRALARGFRLDELLVVEFCDTADASGIVRKYGAFIVGDRVIPKNVAVSRDWMVKRQGTEDGPEFIEENVAYVLSNPHQQALTEIFQLAGVGYGRIDYAVKGGRIQTWEINLTPTIGQGIGRSSGHLPEASQRRRAVARDHFYLAFQDAWEGIDSIPDGPRIPITLDDRLRREALARTEQRGLIGRVRATLGPLDRIVKPLGVRAMPLLAAIAKRASRLTSE